MMLEFAAFGDGIYLFAAVQLVRRYQKLCHITNTLENKGSQYL